ncbi:hypothetical protein [Saccharibacillus kuerlensis]|uniref:Uncharacterized protein n=1 Tax=Saccharibacillus kuerlensis TaxID=459527 RepID=A0ABQ2L9G9_9BACL|nr:hypothetical protein [Saccharibacillus kuerlensis]GGO07272.1 hypothetical protein GCM10010969_35590 [Saccharibacillus kuerlensis]
MKKAVFIGDRDKTDLLFYLAKTISQAGKKVLIVDATAQKSYEFAYPALDVPGEPQEYDGFEVWIPAGSLKAELQTEYDLVLYDTDDSYRLSELPESDFRFLMLGCELTSVRRAARLLDHFFAERPIAELCAFRRVLIEGAREPGESYIMEQFEPFPIDWKEAFVYYPDERDLAVKIGNQYAGRLKMKGLSKEIKKAVHGIAAVLLETDEREVRKLWKKAERSR